MTSYTGGPRVTDQVWTPELNQYCAKDQHEHLNCVLSRCISKSTYSALCNGLSSQPCFQEFSFVKNNRQVGIYNTFQDTNFPAKLINPSSSLPISSLPSLCRGICLLGLHPRNLLYLRILLLHRIRRRVLLRLLR
jgi:hypothetical protein